MVLLGAGGAGTAVAHALVGLGARRICVVDPDQARAMPGCPDPPSAGSDAGAGSTTVAPDDVPALLQEASGLVNATPVGMAAHPGTPVAARALRPGCGSPTSSTARCAPPARRRGRDRGCRVLSGAGMAVHQAADAFELITGRSPDRDAMFRDFDELVAAERARPPHAQSGTTEERNQ